MEEMPAPEPQPYVAYRAASDEYEVRFFGGPLDGARIRTDVFPDCSTFVHRVHNRVYTYRYHRVGNLRFDASLVTKEPDAPERPAPTPLAKWAIAAVTVALATLGSAVALWQISRH